MATYSSILAWKIPWTKEPGRLQPWACKKSDMTEPMHMRVHMHTHTYPRSQFQHAGFPDQVSNSCLLHWEHSLRYWTAGVAPSQVFMPPSLGGTLHLDHEFSPLLVQGWGGTVGFWEWEWGQRTLSHLQMCALLLGSQGESRELLLQLLILNCFQLKIILTPKRKILGW